MKAPTRASCGCHQWGCTAGSLLSPLPAAARSAGGTERRCPPASHETFE